MTKTQTQDILQELAATLQEQIEGFQPTIETVDVGTVIEVGDGISRASGLANVQMSELVEFEGVTHMGPMLLKKEGRRIFERYVEFMKGLGIA